MNIRPAQAPASKKSIGRIGPSPAKPEIAAELPAGLRMREDLPASVASSLTVYRDLGVAFTTSYRATWSNRGVGSHLNCSTWAPQAGAGQADYFALGDLMVPESDAHNPGGAVVSLLVADLPERRVWGKGPALMAPIGCESVWSKRVYRMIAPDGYVAVGGIATHSDEPDLSHYRCVRADLLVQGLVSEIELYDDQGSSERDNLSVWTMKAAAAPAGKIYLAPPTFIPVDSYDRPSASGFHCLQLDVPDNLGARNPIPAPPAMTSLKEVPDIGPMNTYTTFLPWYTVRDPGLSEAQRLTASPVYLLCRTDAYRLVLSEYNRTSAMQQVPYSLREGIPAESATSFANAAGIEIGQASDFATEALSGSIRLSEEFACATDEHGGMQGATTVAATLTIPPGVNAAVYAIVSTYSLQRQDGTLATKIQPQFSRPDSAHATQFPASGAAQATGHRTEEVRIQRSQ